MATRKIIERRTAIQYDGTNSAEILAHDEALAIISETGGVLTLSHEGSGSYEVPEGGWVRYGIGGQWQATHTAADFAASFLAIDEAGEPPARLVAAGVATVPALTLLDPTETVQITIDPEQADTDFTAHAALVGAAGSLDVDDIEIISGSRVDVTVTTSGAAYLAGAQVLVTCSRD